MTEPAEVEAWRRAIAATQHPPARLVVLARVGSTMDAARQEPAGTAVFALRQSRGRGRLGRRWQDDDLAGIALTAVEPAATPREAARLGLAAALAAAMAVESMLPPALASAAPRVGIKWPNDVMADGGKIAGVLVERLDDRALVGIGLNVLARRFEGEVAATATSLAERLAPGGAPPRSEVAAALWRSFALARSMAEESTIAAWKRRDWLAGRHAAIAHGAERLEGRVIAVEPLDWIDLELESGSPRAIRRLDAARAAILAVDRGEVPSG